MTKTMTGWFAVLVALVPAGSVLAHHSLANYDTTKAVRVKGTIIRFQEINPHSFIFLEQQGQIASADPSATSLSGRLLNGELMVMPDGREQSWGDYGVHRCFAPGHVDQHSR